MAVDIGALSGAAGALLGVGLGSWLASRRERNLQRAGVQEARRQSRLTIFVDVLSAYRKFRRFLQTQDVAVQVIDHDDGRAAPVLLGGVGRNYWEAVEDAMAAFNIAVVGGSALDDAAIRMRGALWGLLHSRSTFGAGEIPDEIRDEARDAERSFAEAARQELA